MRTKLKDAIAYVRVSTKKQGATGNGHELQTVSIREFARHEGYRIIQTFSDAETGMGEDSIRNREGVVDAIRLAQKQRCPILVDGLDRFSRNVNAIRDAVVKWGLEVIDCRSGENDSHAVVMARAARAQREGELISINTKRALKERKDQGVKLGNPTNLGEAQIKGGAANRAKAEMQARDAAPLIRELRGEGRTTARAIAEGLNLRGYPATRGGAWDAGNVQRLLKRVADLDRAVEQAENEENPEWGIF